MAPLYAFSQPLFCLVCYAYLGALRWEELLGQSTSPLAVVTFAIPRLQNLANDRMRECDGVVPRGVHLSEILKLRHILDTNQGKTHIF